MPAGYVPYYSIERGTSVSTIGSPVDVGASTEDMAMQITITGNVTVLVKGSQNNIDWDNVSDPATGYTASTIIMLDRRVAFYRADATVVSGTVEAVVGPGRGRNGELMNAGPSTTPSGFAIGQIDVSGFLPTSHQITAALPLRVNGGGSTDMTTNPTAFTFLTSGTTNRGVVVYDSGTGGYKVEPATVDDSGNAVVTSLVTDGQVATTSQLYTSGTLQLVRQNVTLVNGDNNDINLGTPGTLRSALVHIVGPGAAYAITGFKAPTNGASDLLIVQDTTGQTLTFKNLTTSAAGNQILTGTGGNVVASIAIFVYDVDNTRWVMLSAAATAATLPVLLQAATPGTTQTGNFNITGTGMATNLITSSVSGDVVYSGTSMNLTGELALIHGTVTLANGDNDNVTLIDTAVRRSNIRIVGPTGAFATTGFVAGVNETLLFVHNTVSQVWTIKNLTGSSAGNQIRTLTGADVVLASGASFAAFLYDGVAAEWILLFSAPAGATGAPTGAQYLTGASDAGLSAERVVTDTATVAWDLTVAGQAKANVPDASIVYAKIQDVAAASKLLGRGSAAGAGDVEEITIGTGLAMTATTLSSTSGAPTSTPYVTTAADAGLSAEKVLPYLANYNPDVPPASPSGTDDEFDDGSISGSWTVIGTPDTASETTYHGYLYLQDNDTTETGYYIAYAPGGVALSVAVKVVFDVSLAANCYCGIVLTDSSDTALGTLSLQRGAGVVQTRHGATGGSNLTLTDVIHGYVGYTDTYYLMLQRDATTGYTALTSKNGIFWNTAGTWTQAGTIARCRLVIYGNGANTSAAFDFVRMFTSQTTIIGAAP